MSIIFKSFMWKHILAIYISSSYVKKKKDVGETEEKGKALDKEGGEREVTLLL